MIGDSESNKYSYKGNENQGGFSFVLWKVKNQAEFIELNTIDYQGVTYGKNTGILLNKDGIKQKTEGGFSRLVYLLFEKEGYVVETYVGNDVSEEDLEKVLSNLSLKETTKEKASYAIDYEKYQAELEEISKYSEKDHGKLSINSPNLFKIGEKVKANDLKFTVTSVEVFDHIKEFDMTNFKNNSIETIREERFLSEDLTLQSYTQQIIELGDG